MIPLAVFGDPIGHSLSPAIHRAFAAQFNLAIDYRAILAPVPTFPNQLAEFRSAGGCGANVTVPHKITALSLATSASPAAKQAGAANTLIATEQGWHADNTDGLGLSWALRLHFGALRNQRVLLLGAGGAARGVIGALLAEDIKQLIITNRTVERAQKLAGDWAANHPVTAVSYADLADNGAPVDLIINATSAGLTDQRPPLPEALLSATPNCYDMVYGAKLPPFVQWAEQHGCKVADGLAMLVGQAAESFQRWTGKQPDGLPVLEQLRESIS